MLPFRNPFSNSARSKSHAKARRLGRGIERLESREVLSASPMPVLLVIADQQDFYFSKQPALTATESPVEAIDHGVTVLAWARVEGSSPQSSGSHHTGGANVALGDGSVRFVRSSVTPTAGGVRVAVGDIDGDFAVEPSAKRVYIQDDVVVDGRIITGENYESGTMVRGGDGEDLLIGGSTGYDNAVDAAFGDAKFLADGVFATKAFSGSGRDLLIGGLGVDQTV